MFRLLEQLYAIPNQKAIVSKLNEFLSSKFLATGEAWTHCWKQSCGAMSIYSNNHWNFPTLWSKIDHS